MPERISATVQKPVKDGIKLAMTQFDQSESATINELLKRALKALRLLK